MTFRDALWRVLDRMLEYTERDGYGNTTRRRIDDPTLLDLVQGIEKDIAAFPDLSLSPLDEVRLALQTRLSHRRAVRPVLPSRVGGARRRACLAGPAPAGGKPGRYRVPLQHRRPSRL